MPAAKEPAQTPSPAEMEVHVRSLDSLLPRLEALVVRSWENSNSCKSIDYSRGNFQQDVPDGLSCYSSHKPAQPFDERAEADFQLVAAAVRQVSFTLEGFGFIEQDGARIVRASFALDPCYAYEYARSESLAAEEGSDLSRVSGPWYFRHETGNLF